MEDSLHGVGEGIELALPGDTIRRRHIATRASNRRRIVVLVVGDVEFDGYSIGLDSHSLQILELPSGEVSSVALEYIVAISDGKMFSELTREQKDVVDRRTASFRKTSQTWLVKNWPNVYDRRDDDGTHHPNRQRVSGRPVRPGVGPGIGYGQVTIKGVENSNPVGGSNSDADSQVRN